MSLPEYCLAQDRNIGQTWDGDGVEPLNDGVDVVPAHVGSDSPREQGKGQAGSQLIGVRDR